VPLNSAEFSAAQFNLWRDRLITSYAAEKIAAGTWSQTQAPELSRQSFDSLLVAGLKDLPPHPKLKSYFTLAAQHINARAIVKSPASTRRPTIPTPPERTAALKLKSHAAAGRDVADLHARQTKRLHRMDYRRQTSRHAYPSLEIPRLLEDRGRGPLGGRCPALASKSTRLPLLPTPLVPPAPTPTAQPRNRAETFRIRSVSLASSIPSGSGRAFADSPAPLPRHWWRRW
jgi:hypothetical protein